jgi:uracil-DNA glycosylase family 4
VTNPLSQLQSREKQCTRCSLRVGCRQVVPGNGPFPCPIMMVGESPGSEEDDQGLPFVGPSGQLLDKMLRSSGMPRETVYVSNVCRCRPPGNRVPASSEIAACKPWLWEEMKVVRPTAVITLGATPAHLLVKPGFLGMKAVVGKAFRAPYLGENGIIVPVFHPSYLLRGNMKLVEEMVKVFIRVKNYVDKVGRAGRTEECGTSRSTSRPPG